MRPLLPALCLLALMGTGWSAAAAPRSITVVLMAPDGTKAAPIEATDVSISVNRSTEPATADLSSQASISLDSTALANKGLLEWLKQNGTGAVITVESRGAATMVYELRGISSRSANVNHSTSSDGMLALSLTPGTMTVNGVAVK